MHGAVFSFPTDDTDLHSKFAASKKKDRIFFA